MKRELAVFYYYIFYSTLLTFLSYYLWVKKENNILILNINTIFELIFLSLMYAVCFRRTAQWIISILTVLVLGFGISVFITQGNSTLHSNTKTAESILIIIFSTMYFIKLLNMPAKKPLNGAPMFWINCGLLVYFSAGLFLFALSNKINKLQPEIVHFIWGLDMLFTLASYTLLIIGIWKTKAT
jgi:hypothetical protein